MKKTVIASTLALGVGATGLAAGNADAAESQNVDKGQLAQAAQADTSQLNQQPVQDGSYNYQFNKNGVDYNFQSDGTSWSWSYNGYNNGTNVDNSGQVAQNNGQSNQAQGQVVEQQPAQQQQAPQVNSNEQPQQEQAKQEQPKQESSSASEGSSVEVNDHLKQIAERESGGDTNAVNPSSGAAGKYQFLQTTWDSVAPDEYKGKSPTEAPESVQDETAQKLYDQEGPSQWVTA